VAGYNWSGNVRELENVVLQAVVLAKSSLIDASDLPQGALTESKPVLGIAVRRAWADQLGEPEKTNPHQRASAKHSRQHQAPPPRTLQISRTTTLRQS